ncbi:MAG: hypothetical protein ACYDH5_14935 [Acidimicrobiales bacterium]
MLGDDAGPVTVVAAVYDRVLTQSFPAGRQRSRPALLDTSLASAEMVKYASNAFKQSKALQQNGSHDSENDGTECEQQE